MVRGVQDVRVGNARSVAIWYQQLTADEADALSARESGWPDRPVDAVVVGAGIVGLSTAYQLAKRGSRVVVLELGRIGNGESGRTTAQLASALDDRFYRLEKIHGHVNAVLAAQSHRSAIDSIESICAAESIDCEFERVPGFLFAAPGGESELRQEFAAAQRVGQPVEWLQRPPLAAATGPCLRFAGQAQCQPLRYLLGLARAIRRLGGRIYTHTRMERIEHGPELKVHVLGQPAITTGALVLATNSPVLDRFALHTKQAAYRSYVVGVPVAAGSLERGLYWDTLDPYHYVRLDGDDLLLVGGEDHKVGQCQEPERCWERLATWVREQFPDSGPVRYRWSGQIQEPDDGLAFIGRSPGSLAPIFVASGDSGNGMTHGAIAGILLTDLIEGAYNPWAAIYDPSRKVLHPSALHDFLRENSNVALHFAQWLVPGRRRERPAPGSGAIERNGLHPVALYVDDQGDEHRCSAVCPHLGCIVAWNSAERSWDCPCHGSRFDPHGRLLNGPAIRDLSTPSQAPDLRTIRGR